MLCVRVSNCKVPDLVHSISCSVNKKLHTTQLGTLITKSITSMNSVGSGE